MKTEPINFVQIEGGTFIMGSPDSERNRWNDEVQHKVTVSAFKISNYLVRQDQYAELMRNNPSYLTQWNNPSYFKGDDLPVEYVSWYDAIDYCNRLSIKEGLIPAYTIDMDKEDPKNKSKDDGLRWIVKWNKKANGYRLPTEAEWEYACRAGTTTPFSTGKNITTKQANYNGDAPYNNNAKGIYIKNPTPVGFYGPNPWGLYDMHGNVFEWCWDWFGEYKVTDQTDPTGAASGAFRVIRGGAWSYNGWHLRSAYRNNVYPDYRHDHIGFRVVRM
ncbi:MAG: formylglycine-generating enzyme family protein [Leptospirales bacterium]|nr:formylglycine-generating enzyme family protein [Leptospirales bacterium]